ncbi:MAG: M24 family metallopeptidase [Candidatus Bathyarchaeia archaeon]
MSYESLTAKVDWERMRKERLSKLQREIKKDGLDGLMLFDVTNVRYATNTKGIIMHLAWLGIFTRYALVPPDGNPVIFALPGHDRANDEKLVPRIASSVRPTISWLASPNRSQDLRRWVEEIKAAKKDLGITGNKLGVDIALTEEVARAFMGAGFDPAEGLSTVRRAKIIKTPDELELIRAAATMTDAGYGAVQETIRPGVREFDLVGAAYHAMYSMGMEAPFSVISAGERTSPWIRQDPSDYTLKEGDVIDVDQGGAGPGGYFCDTSRTFLCGDNANEEQKSAYNECWEVHREMLNAIKSGATTADVASKIPDHLVADDLKHQSHGFYCQGHGSGLHLFEGVLISKVYSLEHPERLEKNMQLHVECQVTKGKTGVRLEHTVIVTDTGYETVDKYPGAYPHYDEKFR